MATQNPDPGTAGARPRPPLSLTALAAAGFVVFLVIVIYLGNRLESIEDQLRFTPPVVGEAVYRDSFAIDIVDAQTVYVPVYSHIYSGTGDPYLLAATLSIRNTDPKRSIQITAVSYFDTGGKLVRDYLDGRVQLGPLESTQFLIEKKDIRGGAGANFIVAWNSDEPVYEPIIEAVMVGGSGSQSISFKSIGRPLAERAEPTN